MSVISHAQYKQLADDLGTAYAALRDAYFEDGAGAGDSLFKKVKDTFDTNIAAADDSTIAGSGTPAAGESSDPLDANYSVWLAAGKNTAPPGSIGADLNTTWSNLINTTLTETQAKRTAANALAGVLRALNNHMVSRIYGISTIASYYSTYSSDLFSGTYFSAEFDELSGQLGVTISDDWVA